MTIAVVTSVVLFLRDEELGALAGAGGGGVTEKTCAVTSPADAFWSNYPPLVLWSMEDCHYKWKGPYDRCTGIQLVGVLAVAVYWDTMSPCFFVVAAVAINQGGSCSVVLGPLVVAAVAINQGCTCSVVGINQGGSSSVVLGPLVVAVGA